MLIGLLGLSMICDYFYRPKPPVYRADDVVGVWRHTFYINDHQPMVADVTLTFSRNGKFHERAISDLQVNPIDAEGCWKLDPQFGRVSLDGALEYDDGTWSRGDHCFDLKEIGGDAVGGWRDRYHETWMLGGIIGDPDSDEYWLRESWSRKRDPLGAATQPVRPKRGRRAVSKLRNSQCLLCHLPLPAPFVLGFPNFLFLGVRGIKGIA